MGWTARATLPSSYDFIRDSACYIPSIDKIVLFGGNSSTGNTNAIRIYDVATDTWSTASGVLPFTANSVRARYIPNLNIVAVMPQSSTTWYTCADLTDFATWTTKAGNLSANSVYSATNDDDYMFLVYAASTNAVYVRWEPSSNVRTVLHTATPWLGNYGIVHYNGFIYHIGGVNFDTSEADLVYKYEIATNTFTALGGILPGDKQTSSAAELDGLIFSIGGTIAGGSDAQSTVYGYDPSDDSTFTADALPSARVNGAAVSTGTSIFYLGGANAAATRTNTLYEFTYVPPSPQTITIADGIESAENIGMVRVGFGTVISKRPGFIPIFTP